MLPLQVAFLGSGMSVGWWCEHRLGHRPLVGENGFWPIGLKRLNEKPAKGCSH